jgi:hypothetical protein
MGRMKKKRMDLSNVALRKKLYSRMLTNPKMFLEQSVNIKIYQKCPYGESYEMVETLKRIKYIYHHHKR